MKEFLHHPKERKAHMPKNPGKGIIERYFKRKSDYLCIFLEEFLASIKLPTPVVRETGLLFVLLTEGTLAIKVGYNDYDLIEGDLLIIQPMKPFSIEAESTECKGVVFYIQSDGMIGTMDNHSLIFNLDFLETWSKSKYSIERDMRIYYENIFNRILHEYATGANNLNIVNAYTITLLLELNMISRDEYATNNAAINLSYRFKKLVYDNLATQLSIAEYAERLSVSPNHLNKSIKAATGESASQLLSKIKIIEAKYLLFMAELTVNEIALRLGFEDPSYFSRFFKKHESVTPIEFRKMIDLS
ncbi:AraC family transcriptional regulator [Puteibacter caeruleilacunae]|nr:AraC family transcriptional regulator [Puteibacter caeruleilacunae]